MAALLSFQTTKTPKPDRKDHCWFQTPNGRWKCATCGAVCDQPPAYPTHRAWLPPRFEKLTDEERALVPTRRSG